MQRWGPRNPKDELADNAGVFAQWKKRMGKLNQKVALITGGASGIGKQIAITFAAEGADIVIGDTADMEVVAEEVKRLGRQVLTIKADVGNRREVNNLIDYAIDNFTKIDILVNNAGIRRHAGLLAMTEEDWDAVINVNLKGVFLCTQAAAKFMIGRRYGKIVNIASISGLSAHDAAVNYGASKHGVIGLTRVCARELGQYGINVNAIAPGIILTELIYREAEDPEKLIEEKSKMAALGRAGITQDIANLALFLSTDESTFITGQIIASDGGRTGIT